MVIPEKKIFSGKSQSKIKNSANFNVFSYCLNTIVHLNLHILEYLKVLYDLDLWLYCFNNDLNS